MKIQINKLPLASLAGCQQTRFVGSSHLLQRRQPHSVIKTRTFSPPQASAAPTADSPTQTTTTTTTEQQEASSSFDWKDHWYPVVFEHDLAPGQLYTFTLLEVPLVIWRDGTAVRAFKDACPHRLVPLSEGRIATNGCLECP